jgi:hypothetical protein
MRTPTTIIPDPTEPEVDPNDPAPPHAEPIADADGSPIPVDPILRRIQGGQRDWEKEAEDGRLDTPRGRDD